MDYLNTAIPRFNGYRDAIGRFVPFTLAEEVFVRARHLGARVLLRLELDADEQLCGMLYTNASGLTCGSSGSNSIAAVRDETSPSPFPGAA